MRSHILVHDFTQAHACGRTQKRKDRGKRIRAGLEMMEDQMWDEGLKYIKDNQFHQDFAFQVWMLGSGA